MNILHVVPAFAPCFSAGGVVNAAYQIAKKQVEMGHNVCVFTTDSCRERLAMDKHYDVDVDAYVCTANLTYRLVFAMTYSTKVPSILTSVGM